MRVLVVDDDPGSRLVARAVLKELGHDCEVAPDGETAWALVRQRPPEILVTDWMMPGLDGLELCRRVRGAAHDDYTYIIMVTAMAERGQILRGMEAGADDYLVKPLDPLALEARLLAARRVTSLHAELGRHRRDLVELSRTDALTGVGNRRGLDDDLATLHARCRRYRRRYSLALIDLDGFKSYNDAHGHPAGDVALRAVASALAASVRATDAVYRYGGEEFLIVLPEQAGAEALVVVERVRRAVEALGVPHPAAAGGVLTVSAGLASLDGRRQVSGEELVAEADRALYEAKVAGRNRVVAAGP